MDDHGKDVCVCGVAVGTVPSLKLFNYSKSLIEELEIKVALLSLMLPETTLNLSLGATYHIGGTLSCASESCWFDSGQGRLQT